jgi:hypothetical protein
MTGHVTRSRASAQNQAPTSLACRRHREPAHPPAAPDLVAPRPRPAAIASSLGRPRLRKQWCGDLSLSSANLLADTFVRPALLATACRGRLSEPSCSAPSRPTALCRTGLTSSRFTAAAGARSALYKASAACGTCVSDFTLIGCDSDCCRSIAWLQDLAYPPLALSRLVIRSQSQIPLELLYPAVFGRSLISSSSLDAAVCSNFTRRTTTFSSCQPA